MQTIIGLDGKPKTTINEGDKKAFARVLNMAQHVQANVPALKEIGLNTASGVRAIVKHFETPTDPAA